MLLKAEEGAHVELACVKSLKVSCLALYQMCGNTWTVLDGEAVPNRPLFMEVHRGLCNVLVAPEFQA